MAQAPKQERPTPEEINAAYKAGYMTAAERNDKMRRLADATLHEMIGEHGMVFSYFKQTMKHVNDNWADLMKIADDYKPAEDITGEIGQRIKIAGQVMWREVMILASPLMAFGEVNGKVAEHWALQAGASPGLAKVVNVAVDVGSGFMPVGKLAQSFAKGVQKIVPEAKAVAAKVGKVEAIKPEQIVEEAINQGLKADGIEIASTGVKAAAPADDFNSALRKYHNEIEDVTETKHIADLEKEAEKLGYVLDDLRAMVGTDGKALTPAQILAYAKTLDGPTNELVANAKKVLNGDVQAAANQDKLIIDYFSYTPTFRKSEVEAGRTVRVLNTEPHMKSITNMMAAWAPEAMAKLDTDAARLIVAEDLVAMADDVAKLKNLQIQAATSLDKGSPTWWAKMREGYVNLLLARPITQVRNFIGNSYAAVNSMAERELAGWLSIDEVNGVVKGEGMAQFQGMMAGMADGFSGFKNAFKNGGADAGKLDFIPHQIGGTFGRIINAPTDTMIGFDNYFKAILSKGDLYAQALQQGTHNGLAGRALADYAARRVNVPTTTMMEHAKDFALNQTYQNDLGTFGKMAQGALQTGPLALLFPFMKTPMNLAKYTWNRMPGLQFLSGSLYQDILAGGSRADMAIARLTLSNMMGMFWYGLAQQGLITGGPPVDKQLKRSWEGTHEPYSFATPKGSWQPGQLDPATTQIWMAADFAQVMNLLDEPTAAQTAMAIGLVGVRDMVDKSYWQTVGQAIEFIADVRAGEEPGGQALRLATGPALTGTVVASPLPASVARIIDPVRREARSFMDQVKSRVPGFSADLPPMRDGYGDPYLPPAAIGGEWLSVLSPLTHRPTVTDPVRQEGARLQAKLPMFPWSFGKVRDDFDIRNAIPGEKLPVELTPAQRDRWQVLYRNFLRSPDAGIEAKLLNTPEYKSAPYAAQREMFMNFMAKARTNAEHLLFAEDTDLQKKSIRATAAGVLPLLGEDERPKVEAQAVQAVGAVSPLSTQERENLSRWGLMDDGKQRDADISLRKFADEAP